jgi:succinylglutamate desuccinylase/aspartoacylase family protein
VRQISRRDALKRLAVVPVGFIAVACGGDSPPLLPGNDPEVVVSTTAPPTPTPEPFVLPAVEERRVLMQGTPHETPVYVYGTGRLGPILMTLGGVHGNEPGGWLAAERAVDRVRPAAGALLIVPRANRLAVSLFERTTPELGDLNRLYPGNPDGLPMERMAFEIVQTLREFHVNLVIDMHESWAFYKDRPQNGTAYLGQTVATNPAEPGVTLARSVVDAVNERVLASHEAFSFREFPPGRLPGPTSALPSDTSGNPQAAVSGGSRSSLGLSQHIPGITSLLVEMGQQQALERRIALHIEVLKTVMGQVGIA